VRTSATRRDYEPRISAQIRRLQPKKQRLGCGATAAASGALHAHGCFAGGQREPSVDHAGHLYSRRERQGEPRRDGRRVTEVHARALAVALSAKLRQDEILANWERARRNEPLHGIEPLS
jgi:hypothetical protein